MKCLDNNNIDVDKLPISCLSINIKSLEFHLSKPTYHRSNLSTTYRVKIKNTLYRNVENAVGRKKRICDLYNHNCEYIVVKDLNGSERVIRKRERL